MGAKQNFNLGGINSHFNGLKDAGNMSPTQLALTYSKEQLQHMAQMGVITPTNAVIAGMNIDRISNTNAPPTSTISQDTFAPQQGQLPQRSTDPSNFSKQFSADALNPPLPKGNAQGGIMSIPRPGQKYQHGGVVAFAGGALIPESKDEVGERWESFKKPDSEEEYKHYPPLSKAFQIMTSPSHLRINPDTGERVSLGEYRRQQESKYASTPIPSGKDTEVGGPGVASLTQLPAQRAAQSAKPGAGAGAPPAQLAQPVAPEKDSAFLAMLKGREGSPAYMSHEKVSEGSNDALNRALIRGGAAMMANRDPAIGSGLQGFLQGAGKGATEGLTAYEQYLKEFKDRKVKQDEIAANDRYRTEANRIATATAGLNYETEQKKKDALPIAAEKERQKDVTVATIMAGARNKTLEDAYLSETNLKKKEEIGKMILSTTRGATTKDWGREQMLDTEKVFLTRLKNDVNLQSLTPKQLQIELVKHMREHGYSDYGSNVGGEGGGYQPTKEQLAAFNRNLLQK